MIPIFFITGTSGSGKTTLVHFLRENLSPTSFVVHDFDENGVPENADQSWRITTTAFWLKKAEENSNNNIVTIICGVSVPSEINRIIKNNSLPFISYFGFIKIDENIIKKRLQERGWNSQLINDNINWANHLEKEVLQQKHHLIINCSQLSKPSEIASHCSLWIQKNISLL